MHGHITPTFLLLLFALLHVPVNGVSVHKLSEHVFHVGGPLLFSLIKSPSLMGEASDPFFQ